MKLLNAKKNDLAHDRTTKLCLWFIKFNSSGSYRRVLGSSGKFTVVQYFEWTVQHSIVCIFYIHSIWLPVYKITDYLVSWLIWDILTDYSVNWSKFIHTIIINNINWITVGYYQLTSQMNLLSELSKETITVNYVSCKT